MSLLDRDPRGVIPSPSSTADVSLGTLTYNNPRLPSAFNGNAENALNFLMAHVFPNYKGTVATPAALPGVASPNDYYIVSDDGDGKSAGYIWQVVDAIGAFYKKYDVDWSFEGIYAETLNRTQYMFYHKYGMTDKDASGAAITGLYAGQTLYGGDATGQNLTLNANSADSTGYVQTDNHFRPTSNNNIDLGTSAEKFRTAYLATSLLVGTMTLSSGQIVDSSGQVSFDDENIITSGNITGSIGYFISSIEVGPLVGNALILSAGSITDESGAISFGNENLSTTGTLAANVTTLTKGLATLVFDPDIASKGSITSSTGTINFNDENLETTGNITGAVITGNQLNIDNLRLDGNTISSISVDENIILLPNGTGIVDVQKAMQTLGQTITGIVTVTGQHNVDNLRLDGNVFSSVAGDITLTPFTGVINFGGHLMPSADMLYDIGDQTHRVTGLFMEGMIHNGTLEILTDELMMLRSTSFRDVARTIPAVTGDTLFWDSVNQVWLASAPDTEIDHGGISGLLDDDHTQYALLAGRSTGQTLIGGLNASTNLTLQSTAHATRGVIQFADDLEPVTNASYSGGWSGTDIGGSSFFFRDLYMRGEAKNFRFENFTEGTLPASSGQNIGRVMYATDSTKAYVDTGTAIKPLGVSKFLSDTTWNGTDTTKDVTVSSDIQDAREAIWALHDNTNDFDRIYCSIKAISATQVRITVSPALPAGSYRLIGIE